MGAKTIVNREILEVLDNEGMPLFPLLFINREVQTAKKDIESNLLELRLLEPKSIFIQPIKNMLRTLQVREDYVKEKLKMYLN